MLYFVHESSYIDEYVSIEEDTNMWHFCHIQSGASIGRNCSLWQNVNVSNNEKIGNSINIQNNVSVYGARGEYCKRRSLMNYIRCGA